MKQSRLEEEAQAELDALQGCNLLRVSRVLDGQPGAVIQLDGRRVLNFSSNDYLGLAGDGRLAKAGEGAGVGASRLVVGNHREHERLEAWVADWIRCGAARLFNTGYAANVGVLGALLRPGDVVFSDALNHASIVDGCRLSRAEVVVVPHRDMTALELELKQRRGRRRIVVSESLFSMDGDLVDVVMLADLCKRYEAALILDEAHAIGVRGPEGRGVAAEAGVVPDVLIGTFGKALGSFGAFAATTPAVAQLLWNRARTFVFTTALPQSIAATSQRAIEIVRGTEGDDRRRNLAKNSRSLRALVPRLGGVREGAIAPLVVGDDGDVMQLSDSLFEQGVFVQGIRPPTVPAGTARLRVTVSSAHTNEMIERVGRLLVP